MKQVFEYVRTHQLIEEGDRVLVGLSGGADSVCLLFVLLSLQKELDFSIRAIHVNHNLRGEEAKRDEQFAQQLCREWKVPLEIVSVRVSDWAKREKIGTEEAGRKLRYEAFEQYGKLHGITKIALAHHQNDLAETMLYHLARGTDLAGLSAIRPKRGRYIRPLLCLERKQIEQYLKEKHLGYVTDSTNLEDDCTRNRIRHHVVNYLETEVNEQTVRHMCDTACSLGEVYDYLQEEAQKRWEQYGEETVKGKEAVLKEELFEEPEVIVRYVIRLALHKIAGSIKDITREHLSSVLDLADRQVGKTVHLPGSLRAEKQYENIRLYRVNEEEVPVMAEEKLLAVPGRTDFGVYTADVEFEERNRKEFPEKIYTKWLNYDKITDRLVLRFRRTGDYIVVNAQGGRKKIKDYFIDQKIPQKDRDRIPLLCCGSEVLWIVGCRISEAYKVTEDTKKIMKIQIIGGSSHE